LTSASKHLNIHLADRVLDTNVTGAEPLSDLRNCSWRASPQLLIPSFRCSTQRPVETEPSLATTRRGTRVFPHSLLNPRIAMHTPYWNTAVNSAQRRTLRQRASSRSEGESLTRAFAESRPACETLCTASQHMRRDEPATSHCHNIARDTHRCVAAASSTVVEQSMAGKRFGFLKTIVERSNP
jgi:hypothetical protein